MKGNTSRSLRALAVLTALVLGVLLAACGSDSGGGDTSGGSSTTSGGSGPITIASTEGVGTVDPFRVKTFWELSLRPLVFSALTRYTEGKLEPEGDLAESWEASDDLRTYTFTLRPDVEFSNGDPVTAEALARTFDTILNPAAGGAVPVELTNVKGASAADATTLTITLRRPSVSFPDALTTVYLPDPETLRDKPGPVGSGPYVVADFVPDDRVTLEPNPTYYGGAPSNSMNVVATHNQTAGSTALRSGNIDALWQPAYPDIPALTESGEFYLAPTESESTVYTLMMDIRKPPFDNPLARQALAYAIDREAIWESLYKGVGEVSSSGQPTPPSSPFYADGLPEYSYDLDKARELFAQAGVRPGTTFTYWGYAEVNEVRLKGELLKESLAEIDINLDIKIVDTPTWVARICSPNASWPNTIVFNAIPGPEPSGFTKWWTNPAVYCGSWDDPEFKKLSEQADATADEAERKELYAQAQQIFAEQQPVNVFMYSTLPTIVRSTVKNVWIDPAGFTHFENANTGG